MELTYKELQKRDVINITDGKCLGRIIDMKFTFPDGKIIGIFVPGRKVCSLFLAFNRNSLYIPERNINKIGGDVILVNLKGDGNFVPPNPKNPQYHKPTCQDIICDASRIDQSDY